MVEKEVISSGWEAKSREHYCILLESKIEQPNSLEHLSIFIKQLHQDQRMVKFWSTHKELYVGEEQCEVEAEDESGEYVKKNPEPNYHRVLLIDSEKVAGGGGDPLSQNTVNELAKHDVSVYIK